MEKLIQSYNSRRDFLTLAGLTVAGAGLTLASNAAAIDLAPPDKQPEDLPKLETSPKKIGWAIVGLGELALTQILPAFSSCRLSTPVALVSGHKGKATAVSAHYNINPKNIYSYENFDEIKNNNEIQAVYIVLPNSMHAEFTTRALQAGKDVLCEKPMAPTVAECEKMIAASKSSGKKLMIAYRLRYEPFNQKMIELARSNTYGKIRAITAENMQDVKAPNIRLSSKLGGGPLGDVGVYCLNAARYVTGEEPVEVSAMYTQPKDDPRFAEVPDRINFQLKFPSGVLANCSAGFSSTVSRRLMVFAEKGAFGLDPAFAYSGLQAKTSDEKGNTQLKIEAANHFASEMDHFSACISENSLPTTPGEEGLADVRIMEKILQAANEGKTVKI